MAHDKQVITAKEFRVMSRRRTFNKLFRNITKSKKLISKYTNTDQINSDLRPKTDRIRSLCCHRFRKNLKKKNIIY